ncbi:hypothetical protein ACFOPN_02310 [Xanthomonas hyacinthi]|uniref:hypothetical protein n=1 Tax=Xanthomonas hyacinthi TaxID=56455 RepID=UPI001FCA56FB|nr:hypothetical protein [Xanthomonas hyacinthi]
MTDMLWRRRFAAHPARYPALAAIAAAPPPAALDALQATTLLSRAGVDLGAADPSNCVFPHADARGEFAFGIASSPFSHGGQLPRPTVIALDRVFLCAKCICAQCITRLSSGLDLYDGSDRIRHVRMSRNGSMRARAERRPAGAPDGLRGVAGGSDDCRPIGGLDRAVEAIRRGHRRLVRAWPMQPRSECVCTFRCRRTTAIAHAPGSDPTGPANCVHGSQFDSPAQVMPLPAPIRRDDRPRLLDLPPGLPLDRWTQENA